MVLHNTHAIFGIQPAVCQPSVFCSAQCDELANSVCNLVGNQSAWSESLPTPSCPAGGWSDGIVSWNHELLLFVLDHLSKHFLIPGMDGSYT